MITIKDVERAMEIMRTADKEAAALSEEILEHEGTQQDILHKLELEAPSYQERAKLARQLGNVRRKRRIAKDQYDMLQPLIQWTLENRTAYERFSRIINQMKTMEERNSQRIYTCRGTELGKVIRKKK